MDKANQIESLQQDLALAKAKIKVWELEYHKEHGSKPDKESLSAAPEDIKAFYKDYWRSRKLLERCKRSKSCGLLNEKKEESDESTSPKGDCTKELNNMESNRDDKGNTKLESLDINQQSIEGLGSLKEEVSLKHIDSQTPKLEDEPHNDKEAFCQTEEPTQNFPSIKPLEPEVWGQHLNRSNIAKQALKKSKDSSDSLYAQMAEKMKAIGTVKMRKSLKRLPSASGALGRNAHTKSSTNTLANACNGNKENIIKTDNQHEKIFHNNSLNDIIKDNDSNAKEEPLIAEEHLNEKPFEDESDCVEELFPDKIIERGDNSISLFDTLDELKPKTSFRVNSISQSAKAKGTKSVNLITLAAQSKIETVTPFHNIDKGWLTRCTGEVVQDNDEESWKRNSFSKPRNLTSKELHLRIPGTEDYKPEDIGTSSSLECGKKTDVDCSGYSDSKESHNDLNHSVVFMKEPKDLENYDIGTHMDILPDPNKKIEVTEERVAEFKDIGDTITIKNRNLKPVKKPNIVRKPRKKRVKKVEENGDHSVMNLSGEDLTEELSVGRTRGKEKIVVDEKTVPNTNINELQEEPRRSTRQKRNKIEWDEDDIDVEDSEDEWRPEKEQKSSKRKWEFESDDEEGYSDDNDVTFRKKWKQAEDWDELEKQGKIKSSWPPPRKQRISKVKSRDPRRKVLKKTAGKTVKVGAVAATQGKQGIRKRRVTVRKKPAGDDSGQEQDKAPVTVKRAEAWQRGPQCSTIKNGSSISDDPIPPHTSHEGGALESGFVGNYDELEDIEAHGRKSSTSSYRYMSKEERLMKKAASGSLNQNFIRINLKKKTYVRGKKRMSGAKYKQQEWKKKQTFKRAEDGDERAIKSLTCFKCGDFGHWAKYCTGKTGDKLMPIEDYDESESTFLTLEEAADMARGIKPTQNNATKVYDTQDTLDHGNKLCDTQGTAEHTNELCSTQGTANKLCDTQGTSEVETKVNNSQETFEPPDNNHNEFPESMDSDDDLFGDIDEDQAFNTPANIVHTISIENGAETTAPHVSNSTGSMTCNADPETISQDIFETGVEGTDSSNRDPSEVASQGAVEGVIGSNEKGIGVSEPELSQTQENGYWGSQSSSSGIGKGSVKPLYTLQANGEVKDTPDEVKEVLNMFGYSGFRKGQEDAIMRILSGKSTLLVLSTGSGKSLCYQLPAYLYKQYNDCITICVSPLVSLMEDQVTGLPPFLKAVCLHTHQNPTQRAKAIQALQSGRVHILLVSPEAVVASRGRGILGTLLKQLPPVAFACLDEAHCVSEWSHNFRPSYLRVCQVLRECLGVSTILGLTATARHSTALSIASHLLIPEVHSGIIRGASVPANLMLSVSRDPHREEALLALLQGDRFAKCNSIIIYCTRRDECERVATFIRTQLLDPSKIDVKSHSRKTRSLSFDAEAYHAGLSSHRRHQVQKRFMSGKLRVVVATVAFGMGIDKSDVRGIIHFNMPRNVESYVQEIGRAGRDGEIAHCHLFLDNNDGSDLQELRRHIYANSVDRHTVRKFLNRIYKPCTCAKIRGLESDLTDKDVCRSPVGAGAKAGYSSSSAAPNVSSCPGHEVGVPIEGLVQSLDIPEENIETLLCYLDLNPSSGFVLKQHVYTTSTLSCYGGSRQLRQVSRKCPPLAVAIALDRENGKDHEKSTSITFPVVEIAARMGWNSGVVKRELKNLEWDTSGLESGGKVRRSGVIVEFSELGFHMYIKGDKTDDEQDQLLEDLYGRTVKQERDQLRQLHHTYTMLRSASHNSILLCADEVDLERCDRLKTSLRDYFLPDGDRAGDEIDRQLYIRPEVEARVAGDVRALITTHVDQTWTGRAVARVFHGISSPNFPAEVWGRVRRFWRAHLNVDFNIVLSVATKEILRCK
ncbi:recQ4 helicase [Oratosquilla oratoria]|uniref:recQ4 helicase n=1 Tax=Oratosquilla oratoria TaxID=337810 RepID=UPI003F76F3E4